MRFSDLFDLERGPAALVKFALYPLVLLVVLSLILALLAKLPPGAILGFFCLLLLLSPAAYFIRESRRGGSQNMRARRGAERTPLLPQNEEEE